MNLLPRIAGRVPEIHQAGSGWWYIYSKSSAGPQFCWFLRKDGLWHAVEPAQFPTEAAALAFARECAEREAGV
jgi:hypothetical protein